MVRSDTDLVFLYGRLRRGFETPGRELVERYGTLRSLATIEARLYEVDGRPALVVEQDDTETVGEVYQLDPVEEALAALDHIKGLHDEGPYRRVARHVELETGGVQVAWVYGWAAPMRGANPVLGGDYVEHVADG